MPFLIRAASIDEAPRTVATIVAAFLTDPLSRFAWPGVSEYMHGQARLTRALAGEAFVRGTADVTADLHAAALWLPPGAEPDHAALESVVRDTVPAARRDDLVATLEQMAASHPAEPCWYLPLIGAVPRAQGMGLGGRLLAHGLARCDRERAAAYLESTNPRNVAFYRHHGFAALRVIQRGQGPIVTPMLRRPLT